LPSSTQPWQCNNQKLLKVAKGINEQKVLKVAKGIKEQKVLQSKRYKRAKGIKGLNLETVIDNQK
jgi:hypothetical protein